MAAKKTDSRFYLVKTLEENAEELADTVRQYRKRFVDEPVDSGRDLVKEIRKAPRKALGELADDSRELVEKIRKESRTTIKNRVRESRKLIDRVRKNPRKVVTEMVTDGKDRVRGMGSDTRKRVDNLLEGIEGDARLLLDDLKSSGKKAMKELPGGKAVREMRETVEKGLKSIPEHLNLPARDEIEALNKTIVSLKNNVETLRRNYEAA